MTTGRRAVEGCEFCAIGRGEDPSAEVVCSGAEWVAFFPISPATPGHTLIIPKEHVEDLWEAGAELAAELMRAAVIVGNAVRSAVHPEGMNLITSAGSAAEQTVFHLHLHVVPRWQADGFGAIWPNDRRYENPALLDGVAQRIRDSCGGR